MVNLAKACQQLNVDPSPNLLELIKTARPSLTERNVNENFEGTINSLFCPYIRAEWDWIERDTKDGNSRTVKLSANRILLPSLVSSKDITSNWLEDNTILELYMRYPDLMNCPEEQIGLITDKNSNAIFNRDSKCLDGFEKDLMRRRDEEGNVWERLVIRFKQEQEPKFLEVHNGSTHKGSSGLDIIRGEYLDGDDEICTFKILQFITREKIPDADRLICGEERDCGVQLCHQKTRSKEASSPFFVPKTKEAIDNLSEKITSVSLTPSKMEQLREDVRGEMNNEIEFKRREMELKRREMGKNFDREKEKLVREK